MEQLNLYYAKIKTLFFCVILLLSGCQSTTSEIQDAQKNNDLWAHLSTQFKLSATIHNPRVEAYKKTYIKDQAHIEGFSQRAQPFLHYIVKKINYYNATNPKDEPDLPLEIALLPVVESLFEPAALNHSSGSAGLWQFMPATAKGYGLKITDSYDGRLNVDRSTDAAIKYLTYLRSRFNEYNNHDAWLYTLAAYNSGYGRVNSAIRANKKAGKPYDYWSLSLPVETKFYVPKLIALAQLISESQLHDTGLVKIKNKPVLALVKTDQKVKLETIAQKINMPLADLKDLNPGFIKNTTVPPYATLLLIPVRYEHIFNHTFNPDQIKNNRAPLNRFTGIQTTRSNDTFSTIIDRYITTIDQFKVFNHLIVDTLDPDNLLHITGIKPKYNLKHFVKNKMTTNNLLNNKILEPTI